MQTQPEHRCWCGETYCIIENHWLSIFDKQGKKLSVIDLSQRVGSWQYECSQCGHCAEIVPTTEGHYEMRIADGHELVPVTLPKNLPEEIKEAFLDAVQHYPGPLLVFCNLLNRCETPQETRQVVRSLLEIVTIRGGLDDLSKQEIYTWTPLVCRWIGGGIAEEGRV